MHAHHNYLQSDTYTHMRVVSWEPNSITACQLADGSHSIVSQPDIMVFKQRFHPVLENKCCRSHVPHACCQWHSGAQQPIP